MTGEKNDNLLYSALIGPRAPNPLERLTADSFDRAELLGITIDDIERFETEFFNDTISRYRTNTS